MLSNYENLSNGIFLLTIIDSIMFLGIYAINTNTDSEIKLTFKLIIALVIIVLLGYRIAKFFYVRI